MCSAVLCGALWCCALVLSQAPAVITRETRARHAGRQITRQLPVALCPHSLTASACPLILSLSLSLSLSLCCRRTCSSRSQRLMLRPSAAAAAAAAAAGSAYQLLIGDVRASGPYHALVSSVAMPLLRSVDAERAHKLGIQAAALGLAPRDGRLSDAQRSALLRSTVLGLRFRGPVGLAAGFDKQAEAMAGLFGCG